MDNIFLLFEQYLEDIKDAENTLKKLFGDINFLWAKNTGIIPTSSENIKNSKIKGYSFSGRGASFRKKKYDFSIEFDFYSNSIGFSEWNLSQYLSNILKRRVNHEEVKEVLQIFSDKKLITQDKEGNIYIPTSYITKTESGVHTQKPTD